MTRKNFLLYIYLVRSDNHYIEHNKDSREWDVLETL